MSLKENNTIFLKDITTEEIKPYIDTKFPRTNFEILNYSDFYGNRKSQLKEIRKRNSNIFILGIYDYNYLKWSYVFFLMVFFSNAKSKFIIDSKGEVKNVNFFSFLKNTIGTFFSVIIQLSSVLIVPYYLIKYKTKKDQKEKLKNIKDKTIAYIRTTDTFNLTSGGSLGHTLGVISGFKKKSIKVDFYGIDNIKDLEDVDKNIIKPKSLLLNVLIFNRFIYSILFSRKVKSGIESKNSVIYQRISRDDISGLILSKKLNIPLIVEFNSFISWELNGNEGVKGGVLQKITEMLEKLMLRNADLIVTVSHVLKEQLISRGYDDSKICVAYNGVNTNRFKTKEYCKEKSILNIPKEAKVIGFCGTFGYWHGIDILTESIKEVIETRKDCYFLLIGDGLLRNDMEIEFRDNTNVIFTGKVPYKSIVNYLSICDILVSPHKKNGNESFIGSPTKLFEYLSMEKIVIATNLDQISEVVSPSISYNDIIGDINFDLNNKVGIKVEQGSVKELSKAIIYSLDNMYELNVITKNARNKAIKSYSWEATIDQILKVAENE